MRIDDEGGFMDEGDIYGAKGLCTGIYSGLRHKKKKRHTDNSQFTLLTYSLAPRGLAVLSASFRAPQTNLQ